GAAAQKVAGDKAAARAEVTFAEWATDQGLGALVRLDPTAEKEWELSMGYAHLPETYLEVARWWSKFEGRQTMMRLTGQLTDMQLQAEREAIPEAVMDVVRYNQAVEAKVRSELRAAMELAAHQERFARAEIEAQARDCAVDAVLDGKCGPSVLDIVNQPTFTVIDAATGWYTDKYYSEYGINLQIDLTANAYETGRVEFTAAGRQMIEDQILGSVAALNPATAASMTIISLSQMGQQMALHGVTEADATQLTLMAVGAAPSIAMTGLQMFRSLRVASTPSIGVQRGAAAAHVAAAATPDAAPSSSRPMPMSIDIGDGDSDGRVMTAAPDADTVRTVLPDQSDGAVLHPAPDADTVKIVMDADSSGVVRDLAPNENSARMRMQSQPVWTEALIRQYLEDMNIPIINALLDETKDIQWGFFARSPDKKNVAGSVPLDPDGKNLGRIELYNNILDRGDLRHAAGVAVHELVHIKQDLTKGYHRGHELEALQIQGIVDPEWDKPKLVIQGQVDRLYPRVGIPDGWYDDRMLLPSFYGPPPGFDVAAFIARLPGHARL
ncbi:MAG TPA: hypothetical protein VIU34_24505, partial [Steroidobacter sp.]